MLMIIGTSFVEEGQEILPILSAGHFNVTKKNFTKAISKHKLLLVGFSSHDCHKCIAMENEYRVLSSKLKDMKIPFARADGHKLKVRLLHM
jgi:hypothetical protein